MTVKPSRRVEYAALTRQALLEAAGDLFTGAGFDSTSIDDIAREARVSKGAVYHHFDDKKSLFDEVFRAAQKELLDQVGSTLMQAMQGDDTASPARQLIARATDEFLTAYARDARKRSLLSQSAEVLGVHRCREIDNELALPMITGLLEELKQRGELHDVSVPVTATIIFGTLCEAATSVALSDAGKEAADEAAAVIKHMLSGLTREAVE